MSAPFAMYPPPPQTESLQALPLKANLQNADKTVTGHTSCRKEKIILIFQPPMPQREVARKTGISRSYVSRLEKKALSKLETELQKRRNF
ncbi:MAG: helix-turn-helix domain-containing protein [Oscillospiraceae bacterium]|nr:helix-turn-helix domain-containing protein [Oscillospiraceae bacterium]